MFRILENIIEAIGWLQIVASPLLIGLGIGALIYFPNPSATRLVLGLLIALTGLVTGMILATKAWKGKGTIWFITQISATSELDGVDQEERTDHKT